MTQHSTISHEKWASYGLSRQILMIGNEMHRASSSIAAERTESVKLSYERILRLVDLTAAVNPTRNLRKELLRWRDLIAELYIRPESDPDEHRKAFRCLLQFTPESAKQIPFVCPIER